MNISIRIEIPAWVNDKLNSLPNKEEWIQETVIQATKKLKGCPKNVNNTYTIFEGKQ